MCVIYSDRADVAAYVIASLQILKLDSTNIIINVVAFDFCGYLYDVINIEIRHPVLLLRPLPQALIWFILGMCHDDQLIPLLDQRHLRLIQNALFALFLARLIEPDCCVHPYIFSFIKSDCNAPYRIIQTDFRCLANLLLSCYIPG
ncbi:hypothetical protein D3C77_578260 [compost metagenome]